MTVEEFLRFIAEVRKLDMAKIKEEVAKRAKAGPAAPA